jgi:FAD:protein FMN transferase
LITILLLASCTNVKHGPYVKIAGETQGTTYHITYEEKDSLSYQADIDSLLELFDLTFSIYNPSSIVSRINANDSGAVANLWFMEGIQKAMAISKLTDGAFDITVGPLVNAWGFGNRQKSAFDKERVDSLRKLVGYQKITLKENLVIKKDTGMQLDFNAIAQGHSVDIVSEFMEKKNIKNYLVEIGGELRARGENAQSKPWSVGIDKPNDNMGADNRQMQAVVGVSNKSIATSGNYRKFYIEDGKRYSHHIDPKTGYPTKNNLLSVSVMADKCIDADAMGTAFLVMGLEKSKEFLRAHPEFEAYFIWSDDMNKFQVYMTPGFAKILIK